MTISVQINLEVMGEDPAIQKYLDRLPQILEAAIENDLDTNEEMFLFWHDIKASITESAEKESDYYRVWFEKSIPAKTGGGYAVLHYYCANAIVEKVSAHYVLISGDFEVRYNDQKNGRVETLEKVRKKIGSRGFKVQIVKEY